MRLSFISSALLFVACATAAPTSAKVFLRIAQEPMPPAQSMDLEDVVLRWPVSNSAIYKKLKSSGYRIFIESKVSDLASAAKAAQQLGATGVFVEGDLSDAASTQRQLQNSKSAYPNLVFRLIIPGGKQPQMKSRLIADRNGVLQVSSPSAQPWLDTNFALVRLSERFHPDAVPVLYDFDWQFPDDTHRDFGPSADEYALAMAEAAAIHADVAFDLDQRLQRSLAAENAEAWAEWKKVKRFATLADAAEDLRPIADIGVASGDEQRDYEAINLMARHNLAFQVILPGQLMSRANPDWNSLVVFCALNKPREKFVAEFAAKGGTVVIVNQPNDYAWHSAAPDGANPNAPRYPVGAGQIIEFKEPVTDPEVFARDLRRLIGADHASLALWNSLTTLVTAYRGSKKSDLYLDLVNYAGEPSNVQVRVKGRFNSVELDSPGEACCRPLPSVQRDGFTEFTVAASPIAARIRLRPTRPADQPK